MRTPPLFAAAFFAAMAFGFVRSSDCQNLGTPSPSVGSSKPGSATMANQISQYGITWTFDQPYPVGKFVTGDWWVVGPAVVKSVVPAPAQGRNGSMVNPKAGPPTGWKQPYDDRGNCFDKIYDKTLGAVFPLHLKPGQSLVSTTSVDKLGDKYPESIDAYNRFALRAAAVLTCLESAPPEDSFRPAYVGVEKKIWTVRQLRRDILPRLALPPGAIPADLKTKAKSILEKTMSAAGTREGGTALVKFPSVLIQERLLQRVWLDYVGSAPSGGLHPQENMPGYGREMTNVVSTVGLMLLLDDPKGENEQLLRHFIQLGIDYAGVQKSNSNTWIADGGIDSGRKLPLIFAGLMLGDQEMANAKGTFAEDEQTYHGNGYRGQSALWRIRPPPCPSYEELPPQKWKEGPFANTINTGWREEGYRNLNSPTWTGEALVARLLGAKKLWSHDAFFDYVERWIQEAPNGTFVPPKNGSSAEPLAPDDLANLKPLGYQPFCSDFVRIMWETYRPKADQIGEETAKRWAFKSATATP